MNLTELVDVSSRLADVRKAMQDLFGGSYAETVRPWRDIIRARSQQENQTFLGAGTALAKDAPSAVQSAIILSAALDLTDEAPLKKQDQHEPPHS